MKNGAVLCLCLCLCISVRLSLILLFPQLGSILDQTVQFSTPVTSFKSLKEGLFLLNHSMGLYEGGIVYLPPLLLQFVNLLQIGDGSQLVSSLLFIFLDCLLIWQLYSLEMQLNQTSNCAWVFALNPITILSCISKSTIVFTYLPLISTLYFISTQGGGNLVLSSLMMSVATYLDPIMGILLVPTLNFIINKSMRSINRSLFYLVNFVICLFLLYWTSPFPLSIVYGTRLNFNNVVPNMGLWWYFFIEMFQEFIPFFKSVFNLFSICMVIPLTVRFNNCAEGNGRNKPFPLYCWIISLGWVILTKPYPTLGETGMFLSLLPLLDINQTSILRYMRYPMLIILLFLHSILLSPIFYHLWIDLGSGNSNFFYAISLVYNLALGLLISDITWGVLRLEYDGGRPNYTRKLTQV